MFDTLLLFVFKYWLPTQSQNITDYLFITKGKTLSLQWRYLADTTFNIIYNWNKL